MFGLQPAAILGFFTDVWSEHKRTTYTRSRTFTLLGVAKDPDDRLSRFFDGFLVIMIVLNVLAVMLESSASIRAAYGWPLFIFEAFSVLIFGTEYIARVWSCLEDERYAKHGALWGRIRYMLTPMAITDLVAIMPFFIILAGLDQFVDLRFLRIMRLRRAFKLNRYSPAMDSVFGVLRDELRTLGAIGFVFALVIVMSASTIYTLEGKTNEAFHSIPAAMQWALASLTPGGGMEARPETMMGRAFAAVISIAGVLLVAMITGVMASGFTYSRIKRSDAFKRSCEIQIEKNNGELTAEARKLLDFERRQLGFTSQDAQHLLNQVLQQAYEHDLAKLSTLRNSEDVKDF